MRYDTVPKRSESGSDATTDTTAVDGSPVDASRNDTLYSDG